MDTAKPRRRWLTALLAALKWSAVSCCLLFSLWMFTYSMPFSGLFGLAVLWVWLKTFRQRKRIGILLILIAPLYIWNVGLVEYGRKTLDLHCRVLGYAAKRHSTSCKRYARGAYERGRRHRSGPLFGPVERLGVHGFNVILATGGTLAGFPEVAWETLYMSFASEPTKTAMSSQPKRVRLRQCVGGASSQKHSKSVRSGDFMMDSSTIRKLVVPYVRKARRLKPGQRKKFAYRPLVVFRGKGSKDNSFYGSLLRSDNFKAPITLVVPDGHISAEGYGTDDGPYLDVRWTGTISYPHNASFVFSLPTVWQLPGIGRLTGFRGPFPLMISESIFCGMTMDGAMNPYTQVWTTRVAADDPRLTRKGIKESQRGWMEYLLRLVL